MAGGHTIAFDHIHIISKDPTSAAAWYVDMLGGVIEGTDEVRGAPQVRVAFDDSFLLIRGQRPGEEPGTKPGIRSFGNFSSHDQWGTDHFGFRVTGDFYAFCETLRAKGATFSVEPHEFSPGFSLAYLVAPDGVSVEVIQA